jgi:hypothetical protein
MPKGKRMDDLTNEQSKLIQAIIDACEKLGWAVALPTENIDDHVDGMIIGTPDYIHGLIGGSDEHDIGLMEEDLSDEFENLDADDFTKSNVDLTKKKYTH